MKADKQTDILSALMDGEASELEIRQLLVELDESATESWSRWHLAQDVMQGHSSHPAVSRDFCASVSQAIAEERLPAAPKKWWPAVSRVAVAASVALAVVGGWQVWQTDNAQMVAGQPVAIASSTAATMPSAQAVNFITPANRARLQRNVQTVSDTFPIRSKQDFTRLIRHHGQIGMQRAQQGMMPYVRMIDMDARAYRR